ncbi:MAG: hypothetical protein COA44_07470 [Arcobacter sp.]|nr:MAG: hypothetical protein COA44_07470 [Arcobacter sp.]
MLLAIDLLEIESKSLSQHISGISTITFYKGDIHLAAKSLKERFSLLLEANPWIAGKLVKTKQSKNLQLLYSNTPSTNIQVELLFKVNPPDVKIHSDMPYSQLGKACSSLIVQRPTRIINKEEYITKLTLVEDTKDPQNKFSLIFSLSHSVGDGHTYYSLLNMLSKDAKIEALTVQRKEEIYAKAIKTLGKKEFAYLTSFSHVFNVFRGMICGKKAKVYAFYLDENKISELKAKKKEEQAYISTNDILTSSFSTFTGARLCAMAINFRNKIKGLDNKDAGNYEGAILYDKRHYKSPSSIRHSLINPSSYQGLSKPLPKTFEGMFCKMGLITNWASFAKDLNLQDAKEELHLPLTNTAGRMPYEMCVVFRAKEGKTGLIYFTQRFKKVDFNPQSLPIGKLISNKIFT